MRMHISQAGLDEIAVGRELRLAADIADPIGNFAGQRCCEGNWEELTVEGYRLIELSPHLDPAYFIPVQGVTRDRFYEDARHRSSRHVVTSLKAERGEVCTWGDYLVTQRRFPRFYSIGAGAKDHDALQTWAPLKQIRSPSSFAILVDPYLHSNGNHHVENVATLVGSIVAPPSRAGFDLVVLASWSERSRPPRPRRDWQPEVYVSKTEVQDLRERLIRKGFQDVRVHYVQGDNVFLGLPRQARLHDRFLLTQELSLICGTGFGSPSGRPNFSEVIVQHNFSDQRSHRSFSNRLGEVARYISACKTRHEESQMTGGDFVMGASNSPATLLSHLREIIGRSLSKEAAEQF